MPQMAPAAWLPLLFLFIFIFHSVGTFIYYNLRRGGGGSSTSLTGGGALNWMW